MFCTKCGQENPDTGAFCKKCGSPLSKKLVEVDQQEKTKATNVKKERQKRNVRFGLTDFDKAILKRFSKLLLVLGCLFVVVTLVALVCGKFFIKNNKKISNSAGEVTDEVEVKNSLDGIQVGDNIIFGQFEQDGNLFNGKEPLVWDVLDERDGSYLLISHKVIDSRRFDDGLADNVIMANEDESAAFVNWRKSSLREWLNNYFYATTFNSDEREKINITSLYTSDYSDNNTYGNNGGAGGGATEDKVFLLSYDEFCEYYLIHNNYYNMYCPGGITSPTRYALDQGVKGFDMGELFCLAPKYSNYVFEADDSEWSLFRPYIAPDHIQGRILCSWLLRTPGSFTQGDSIMAVVARGDGVSGEYSVYSEGGIRPAIWVRP